MLGQQYFYYRTIRKVINAVGSVFNDISLQIMNYDSNTVIRTVTVPLRYEGKENWLTRLEADPTADRGTQINLPAMTYEFLTLKYAPERKQSSFIKGQLTQTANNAQRYSLAVPFDMGFELNVYTRNIEDGAQIIEQVLPLITPQYTIKLKYVTSANNWISENLPVILDDIHFENQYEGSQGSVRQVTWTIQFHVQTLFYGPVPDEKVIKQVILDLRYGLEGNNVAEITTSVDPITANVTDHWTANTIITENIGKANT